MNNSKVIIVGNGPSLMNNTAGTVIDAYETVIRFNNYVTKAFESFTGNKTTIWFNTMNFPNKHTEWRIHDNYQRIYLHSWQWDKSKDDLYNQFEEFFIQQGLKPILIKTTSDTIDELQAYIGNIEYYGYSTGLMAIWMMLKEHSTVDIIGFDWWEPNQRHHYHDMQKIGNLHKPMIEKSVIDKLVSEGKIKLI